VEPSFLEEEDLDDYQDLEDDFERADVIVQT
jgi:hypothetical protein